MLIKNVTTFKGTLGMRIQHCRMGANTQKGFHGKVCQNEKIGTLERLVGLPIVAP